jgi:hypothetical protein
VGKSVEAPEQKKGPSSDISIMGKLYAIGGRNETTQK